MADLSLRGLKQPREQSSELTAIKLRIFFNVAWVQARKKLSETEKELSQVIYEQTGGSNNFALIRSKGDQALFNRSTQAMKNQWQVPDNRPLADFAPTLILKAKDFATEITIYQIGFSNLTPSIDGNKLC